MGRDYVPAGRGLYLVFWGQIVGLFAGFPLLGGIAYLASLALTVYGLYLAANSDGGYQTAMYLAVAGIVLGVLDLFWGGGALGNFVGIAQDIVGLMQVYFICGTTAQMLHEIGEHSEADRGNLVWRINLICYLVAIGMSMLVFFLAPLAWVLAICTMAALLVAGVLFLFFLWNSQKAFQR
jgi:hypothetical protein